MAAAMFMNSNSLPIALMQSLVLTVPGLKWGDDDNKDAMLGRALTYLVLYSTVGHGGKCWASLKTSLVTSFYSYVGVMECDCLRKLTTSLNL